MRITGGLSKGRSLAALKGMKIRPTTDQVREAVFSILGQDLEGRSVLDLFAGTGIMGIEALSRGAKTALFVDNSTQALKIIKKNLLICGYEEKGKCLKRDLRKGLPPMTAPVTEIFDLAFLDPPYDKGLIPPVLISLSESYLMADDSWVVAESSRFDELPESAGLLTMTDIRIYGDTKISLYRNEVNI